MDQASTKKMTPGDDMHLTLLMTPHGLNFVTGQDRQHLLAFGRAAFEAGKAAAAAQQGVLLTNEQIEAIEKQVWDLNHFDEVEREGNRKFAHLIAAASHPTPQGMDVQAIERAAQKLAEIAEYNWVQLTEKQREEFRTDALSALTAALGLGHE